GALALSTVMVPPVHMIYSQLHGKDGDV
ncbi:hypothetical protein A2U01_0109299, partial [Trifolium medium]|nr:hypothetical protein [Trifolium medium]